jgi:hypothetical protein
VLSSHHRSSSVNARAARNNGINRSNASAVSQASRARDAVTTFVCSIRRSFYREKRTFIELCFRRINTAGTGSIAPAAFCATQDRFLSSDVYNNSITTA